MISAFVPNRPPGNLVEAKPYQIVNVSVTPVSLINEIRMRVTDQRKTPVDLNGELVTYYLQFRGR